MSFYCCVTPSSGRLEGFAKILKLLLDQDNELTREILKTLKHFLDVQNNAVMDGVKDLAEDTKRASTTITELLPGTIRTVVSDVTRVLVSVFSKGKHLHNPSMTCSESTTATDDYESDKDEATTYVTLNTFQINHSALDSNLQALFLPKKTSLKHSKS